MEADRNPLPEKMQLFWTPAFVGRVGRVISSLVRHLPDSGFPAEDRGAAAMLDAHLDQQQTFDYQAAEE